MIKHLLFLEMETFYGFFFFFSIEYGLKNSIDFRFMTSATFVEV